jgi:hypothetical protein
VKTEDFQSTKLWKQTIRKLRLIAALTGSSMVEVTDRLAGEELKRLGHDTGAQDTTESNA